MLYKDWLDEWLENFVKPSVKIRSYLKYKRDVNLHILPILGNYELDDLSSILLQKFTTSLIDKKLSGSTINGIISVVKNSLKTAIKAQITVNNHSNSIIRPKVCEKEVTCFSKKEQQIIENYIFNSKNLKLFGIVICLYTGLRIGELLSLTWSDIDFHNNILIVNKTCRDSWVNGKYVKILEEPKTNNSKRIIPIPKTIIQKLKEIKKASCHKFVVPAKSAYGIGVRSYQRLFENLLKKMKLEHKGFHSLRHTFATRKLECGIDVKSLSEILGHKNVSITLNRYTHSLMEHKQKMMENLAKNYENKKCS